MTSGAKRIGLIGCGTVASYGHLPAIKSTPGLELTSVLDLDRSRALAAQNQFGARHAFSDAAAFFDSGLDAVVVTTTAPAHAENVLDAARHGLHVLCEKPLATSDAEARTMIAAMARAGKLLVVGFCYRFSPCAREIKRLITGRDIGEARAGRLIYLWDLHGKWITSENGERSPSPRRDARMLEGGPLIDCGVHQIDLARWWFGSEIRRLSVAAAWVDEAGFEAPDHLWLHLDHASAPGNGPVQTLVEVSYSYTHTAKEHLSTFVYEIIGTEGLIRYDREARTFEVRSSRGTQRLEWAPEKNFAGMYEAFAQALHTGEPGDLPTGADGLEATRIATKATRRAIKMRGNSDSAGPSATGLQESARQ